MCRLMRMSAILAFIGSGALFGMEACEANEGLMILPIEKRADVYGFMTNKDLTRFSGVSKDIYAEIYSFKKRKAGIPRLKKGYKEYNDLNSEYLRKGDFRMSLKMHDIADRCYFRLMLEQKRNMRIIKQPWMIKNKEKEGNQ